MQIKDINSKEVSIPVEHYTHVRFVGCVLIYDIFASSTLIELRTRNSTQAVPLSNVYDISVGTIPDSHWSQVFLRLSRPVTYTDRISKPGGIEDIQRKSTEISLFIRNEDDASRLQNAFAVATGLCGAKPDPFDPKNFPPQK